MKLFFFSYFWKGKCKKGEIKIKIPLFIDTQSRASCTLKAVRFNALGASETDAIDKLQQAAAFFLACCTFNRSPTWQAQAGGWRYRQRQTCSMDGPSAGRVLDSAIGIAVRLSAVRDTRAPRGIATCCCILCWLTTCGRGMPWVTRDLPRGLFRFGVWMDGWRGATQSPPSPPKTHIQTHTYFDLCTHCRLTWPYLGREKGMYHVSILSKLVDLTEMYLFEVATKQAGANGVLPELAESRPPKYHFLPLYLFCCCFVFVHAFMRTSVNLDVCR